MAAGVKIIWSKEMLDYIKSSFGNLTARQMANHLNIGIDSVRVKYRELGFSAMKMEYWTDEQVAFLKSNYSTIGDVELALIFEGEWPKEKKWTKKHIEKKRNYLNLHRTQEQIDRIRFSNYHKGLMRAPSRFIDEEFATEGEVKMWKQGSGRLVPRIKINGVFIDWGKWKWEQINGSVPGGMNVVFIGSPEILEISNLTLKSNQDLARDMYTKAQNLDDKYVIGMLGRGNPQLKEALRTAPEIVELKKQQLKLKRKIKEHGTK